jgi:hypothetical protein
MARGSRYPETYGTPTSALSVIQGPLNIDAVGSGHEDECVPANDMAEIPDSEPPDPMTFVSVIQGRGGK